MRFNKQELITLATQPSNKFDKEGPLYVTEKQEGFFRKTEGEETKVTNGPGSKNHHHKRKQSLSCIGATQKVSLEKWCRLRGNLLFYFKTSDQFSEPQGCIVLEKYRCAKQGDQKEYDGYVFYLEFEDGLRQRFATNTEQERLEWMQAIGLAGYDVKRAQLKYLREQIDKKRGMIHDVDVDMLRLQTGKEIGDLIRF